MLWVIAFLLKDSTLISIISKSKYSVCSQVKDHIQNVITSIDNVVYGPVLLTF